MKNIPEVKIGVVIVSRNCFPEKLVVERYEKLIKSYTDKYGCENIYKCPICVNENELQVNRALKNLEKEGCNALGIYLGNFGPEITETMLAKRFNGPVMFCAASEENGNDLLDERGDAYCGLLNASYALNLRGINAYIPEDPVGDTQECADMIYDFIPIARAAIGLSSLKLISFGPRPNNFLACNAPIAPLYELNIEIEENSELDLLESFLKHEDDKRVPELLEQMSAELGEGNVMPEALIKQAQYELTFTGRNSD